MEQFVELQPINRLLKYRQYGEALPVSCTYEMDSLILSQKGIRDRSPCNDFRKKNSSSVLYESEASEYCDLR